MSGTTRNSNAAVVFLVDESAAMNARIAGGTKSKAECVATAINALLNQLGAGPAIDVAVVGYRAAVDGRPEIGSRWAGPLSGKTFVSTSDLAAAPLAVETRTRKVPAANGMIREEPVAFPIWYRPALGHGAVRSEAYRYAWERLSNWLADAAQPAEALLISLLGELGERETLGDAIAGFGQLGGTPLRVFHAHLGTSTRVPATLYPSTDLHLATPAARELFRVSSPLPPALAATLQQAQVTVNPSAHGLIHNAQFSDLVRFLSLVKTFASVGQAFQPDTPAGSATSAAPVRLESLTHLVILLLDRSAGNAADRDHSAWPRLQDQANELLAQVARQGAETAVAVVSYGTAPSGETCVDRVFPATTDATPWRPAAALGDAALRVEEITEQVSNGIGGLVAVRRKKPIFVEQEATPPTDPRPAFAAVGELLSQWAKDQPGGAEGAVVLHITRGDFAAEQMTEAVNLLGQLEFPPRIYHLVRTEQPHASLAYVPDSGRITLPGLAHLWELSSPLLGRQALAGRRPGISDQSRGFVVNGKFDLLLAGIEQVKESGR